MKHFPSWRYHKELAPLLVHNEKQHAHLEKTGWKESPAEFETAADKPVDSETDKLKRELEELGQAESEEAEEVLPEAEPETQEELDEDALRATLIERGHSKKSLKGKSLEQLKEMLAE